MAGASERHPGSTAGCEMLAQDAGPQVSRIDCWLFFPHATDTITLCVQSLEYSVFL